jgi:hypothetical protein
MATTRGRIVQANEVVIDQADYFQADGFTRVVGLRVSDLTVQLFFQNNPQPWPLVDGTTTDNVRVVSGRVFFHEVSGQPGIYSVRWRPNAKGYWRLLLTYTVGQQIMGQDYDVTAEPTPPAGGLKSSFINRPC